MKRLLRPALLLFTSRFTPPVVVGIFLLAYIGIAFFTEDALIALMELTRHSAVLVGLLALLPLNALGRVATELRAVLARRRALSGSGEPCAELFDERVELSGSCDFDDLKQRFAGLGYRTRQAEGSLGAWRGISGSPARLILLAGSFCLFLGILISLTARNSSRGALIEGEPLPAPSGNGGVVERIRLAEAPGLILSKSLEMRVAPLGRSAGATYGIYPPGRHQGAYVYPRYLGIAAYLQFSAPDLPQGYQTHTVLNIYPPGKDAALEVPNSPYRFVVSMPEPADGSDPYATGRMGIQFKLFKGKDALFSGSVPAGGELVRDGYRVAFPDLRRMVITDFIEDYGVQFIWAAGGLYCLALLAWLPALCLRRREVLFVRREPGLILACSRSEGQGMAHGGIFNEALDLMESRNP